MEKILLIEDDQLLIRMYQRKFKSDGYDLCVALNGEEGLGQAREFHPDLIMMDIMMPRMNGLEALEKLKADAKLKDIPVILLTNLGGAQEDIERGLKMGAVAYIVKSDARPDEVVKKVKEVLGSKK